MLADTSRPRRPDETDGQDYHFINRQQFESDIFTRKFVEHGEYEKAYYGTSLSAIRAVVSFMMKLSDPTFIRRTCTSDTRLVLQVVLRLGLAIIKRSI